MPPGLSSPHLNKSAITCPILFLGTGHAALALEIERHCSLGIEVLPWAWYICRWLLSLKPVKDLAAATSVVGVAVFSCEDKNGRDESSALG